MPIQSPFQGILSQYGLDLTADEMRQRRIAEAQANALAATKLTAQPTSQNFANIGAMLGGAITGSRSNYEDTRKAEVATNAQKQFEDWAAQNKDVDPADKALQFQKFLGDEAYRLGFADMGSDIMAKFDAAKAAREKRNLELERLGYDTKAAKMEFDMLPEQQAATRLGFGLEEFVDAFPVSGDTDQGRQLRRELDDRGRPTGNLLDANGNIVYRTGEWTKMRPVKGSTGGVGDDLMINNSEAEKYRDSTRAGTELMTGIMRIDDVINQATSRDGTTDVLGTAGHLAANAVNIADNVSSTMRNVAKMLSLPDGPVEIEVGRNKNGEKIYADGRSYASGGELAAKYEKDVDEVLRKYVPEALRLTGNDATRVRTNLRAIAYSIMRAQEPGNNRYSDADYKNALELAGEGFADPTKLRQTLYDRVQDSLLKIDMRLAEVPDKYKSKIWGNSLPIFTKTRQEFEGRFGKYAVKPTGSTPKVYSQDGYTITIEE